MMDSDKFIMLILACLFLIFFPSSGADIIYLRDGGKIEGEIMDEGPEFIRVKAKIGFINLTRDRIKSIEKKEIPAEETSPTTPIEIKVKEIEKTQKEPEKSVEFEEPKANIVVPRDYPTLKEAIAASKGGDVIFIRPGEYEEKDGLKLRKGITLIGSGADLTKIIIGRGGLKFEDVQIGGTTSDVNIKNITFVLQAQPISLNYVENVEFKNCVIIGSRVGFYILTNERVSNGFYILASKRIEITNCTVAGFNRGVFLGRGPSDITIRNSIFADNKKYNIFVDNLSDMGISWVNPVTGEAVSEERKKKLLDGFKNIKLKFFYNNVWGAENNHFNCQPGKFDISKDPKFVGDGDYHLQSGSPCIDVGDPDKKYNDPDGTRNDLGALSYFKPSTEKEKGNTSQP